MTVVNLVRGFGRRPWLLPPSPDSFWRVSGQREFDRHFVNRLVVPGGVVLVPARFAFLAATAATAVTRFRFRFRSTLSIMFPVARPAPVFCRLRDFAPPNTPDSLILPHIAESPPFASRMLRGFGKGVPEALERPRTSTGRAGPLSRQILFPLAGDTSQSTLPTALMVFSKPDGPDRGEAWRRPR